MTAPDRVVLDTNVVSYLLRQTSTGGHYKRLLAGKDSCIACITLEELYFGAVKRNWGGSRRAALDAFIADCVFLPGTFDVAKLSAYIRAARARAGRPLDQADAWIAATALDHRLPLVTHDRDFQGIQGLRLITLHDMDVEDASHRDSALDDVSLKAAPLTFASFGSSVLN